jgi:osmotically-inducible protein OsmY
MSPKLSRLATAAALSLAAAATLGTAGCAGTPTSTSVGEKIDDSVITSRVKARFVEDKTVSALDIKVETFKGTVQLSGFANSLAEVSRATEIARNVPGVRSVVNDIRLKTAASQ